MQLNLVASVTAALILLPVSLLSGESIALPHRTRTWAALAFVVRFIQDLPSAPAVDFDGVEEVVAAIRRPPGDEGRAFQDVLAGNASEFAWTRP